MGIMRRIGEWLAPGLGFSAESEPRPIAEVILEMSGRGLLPRVSRDTALSVPSVLRSRNLICSVATLPLLQRDAKLREVPLPLLAQIDPDVANVITISQTIEDLFFEGVSWWRVTATDADGWPVYARHLDYSSVSVQPRSGARLAPLPGGYDPRDADIYVDGQLIPNPGRELIRFDSPNPGLLHAAGRVVQRALLLDTTSALYASNPRPLDYFSPVEGADPVTDEDVRDLLAEWAAARKRGTTGYVPAALKYNSVEAVTPADLQLIEMQRKATLDIANATGLDPEDLGISTTSRTYQNGIDRRQDRINDVLSPYMAAITDRLSMRDVTRRGYTVAFDLDEYLRADPTTRASFYQRGIEDGWLTRDEVRREESRPDLTPAQKAELKPDTSEASPVPDNVRPIRPAERVAAAGDEPLHLDFPTVGFAVDMERRVIEGIVVPYGPDKIAMKNGRRWRFQKGSLVYAEASRVKLLRDHDFSQPQGPMQAVDDRPEGMWARFKVGRGPDGDRTLAEAEDKIRDGFSVGVDIIDFEPDPLNQGVFLVKPGGAVWRETSVLAVPAFDDARVSRVAATRDSGESMNKCATCGADLKEGVTHACNIPASQPDSKPENAAFSLQPDQLKVLLSQPGAMEALVNASKPKDEPKKPDGSLTFSAEQVQSLIASGAFGTLFGLPMAAPAEKPEPVNPTRPVVSTSVREPAPYRFDAKGNLTKGSFDFSTDVIQGLAHGDTVALARAEKFMVDQFEKAEFVNSADAATLNPNIQRPDLYVDQREYEYPIWNAINKGTIADATPFVLPKFNTSSGLVGVHTEMTEPTPGTFTATAQTITPAAISGKVEISREAWDQGGNPQLSGLIWRQMERAWYEALEAAAVALLEASAPTTITITTAAADSALEASLTSQLAPLQYVRGGFRMRDAFAQVDLYKALIAAKDSNGRKLFPVLGAQNATGTTQDFFSAVLVAGLVFRPAWALAATSSNSSNSFLFDRGDVSGWATAPRRLTFENIAVNRIGLGIWGYRAMAITDITGLRKLAYDPV